MIEEIKSVVLPPLMFGAIDANAYPHYVEQLRLYCFFVENDRSSAGVSPAKFMETARGQDARATKKGGAKNDRNRDGRATVTGRLVFVNVPDGSSKEIEVGGRFDDCEQLIAERVRLLIDQARGEEQRCAGNGRSPTKWRSPTPGRGNTRTK